MEGQPGVNYWVLRVAGTKKVSSRPRPTGFCFKSVSALLGKTEGRSHQHEDRTSPSEKGTEPSCRVIPAPSVSVVASGSPLHRHTSRGDLRRKVVSRPAVAVCPGRSLRRPGFLLGTSPFWLSGPCFPHQLKRDPCLASLPGAKSDPGCNYP